MSENQIKYLRKNKKLSQKELAERMGITQQAVAKWESGKSLPDTNMLKKLALFYDTTVDHILLGAENTANSFKTAVQSLTDTVSIPIIGTVKAGFNALALNDDFGYEYANVRDPENYFFLIVKGDSMEPHIKDGDLALVHKQNTLEDGDLGVIVYGDNEGTLKRFIKSGNAIILQPFNSMYDAKVLTGDELNDVYIAGKVVETRTQW